MTQAELLEGEAPANHELRKLYLRKRMMHEKVVVRPLGIERPEKNKRTKMYCPLPEYGVALWVFEES